MNKTSSKNRAPRSFSVDASIAEAKKPKRTRRDEKTGKTTRKPKAISKPDEIIFQSDEAVDEAYLELETLTPPPASLTRKSFGWGKLAIGAFTALLAIGVGLWVDNLIREMFSRNDWLGWIATGLTAIGVLAILAVTIREIWGLSRLRAVDHLRQRAKKAADQNDLRQCRRVAHDVISLFKNRPDTAQGRALLDEHDDAVMDGRDLIHLVERDLLSPLDKTARGLVMQSAKRVSIVTAVSPRALVDIGFVLYENVRLIRRIAEHYGGRPAGLSTLRLTREVITHLAATGAIAVGDGLMQQVIGQGLAARLSARLGEGVVNGLLTARIGIAAIDVCRPLTFDAEKRPGVSDFLSELTKSTKTG